MRDLAGRRRPQGHVIVFANEKGGVGKSTLAFHCALALAHRGFKVMAIDCDRRQQTLNRFLEARDGAVRTLRVNLPRPKHAVLEAPSGAMLMQELDRVGGSCDFIVVDLAGHDSPLARRAIALADTIVTPVNCSAADLDSLGSMHPISKRLRRPGPFAEAVMGLRDERARLDLGAFDWVVVKNRVRHCERRLNAAADRSLATMARHLEFRLVDGLTERLTYRELLPFGISHLDLKFLPRLLRPKSAPRKELALFMEALRLPKPRPCAIASRSLQNAPVMAQTVERYREALRATGSVPVTVD
jgi:chromosome partitioning protein